MEVGEDIDAQHTNLEYLKAYLFGPLKGESRGDIRSCV